MKYLPTRSSGFAGTLRLSFPLQRSHEFYAKRARFLPRRGRRAFQLAGNRACFRFLPHERLQHAYVFLRPRSRPLWFLRHRYSFRESKSRTHFA